MASNANTGNRIRKKNGRRVNPFGEIKQLLGLTLLSAKIVPTEAFGPGLNASAYPDRCEVSASADPDWVYQLWVYQLVLIGLGVSLTLNVIFLFFGRWIFTRGPIRDEPAPEPMPLNYMLYDLPAEEQEAEAIPLPDVDFIPENDLCSTPGCARRRNVEGGYTTCCRYCAQTHTHSYQCDRRNGIQPPVQYDEDGNPRFPQGAAPQFAIPFRHMAHHLQEHVNGRIRVDGANEAPQRPRTHLLVPSVIATLPTGSRYHFWPACPHMRMRSARIYPFCGTCHNMASRVLPVVVANDFPGQEVPRGPAAAPAPPVAEPAPEEIEELVVQ